MSVSMKRDAFYVEAVIGRNVGKIITFFFAHDTEYGGVSIKMAYEFF